MIISLHASPSREYERENFQEDSTCIRVQFGRAIHHLSLSTSATGEKIRGITPIVRRPTASPNRKVRAALGGVKSPAEAAETSYMQMHPKPAQKLPRKHTSPVTSLQSTVSMPSLSYAAQPVVPTKIRIRPTHHAIARAQKGKVGQLTSTRRVSVATLRPFG